MALEQYQLELDVASLSSRHSRFTYVYGETKGVGAS